MASSMKTLPLHFKLRGLTVDYMVALFQYFIHQSTNEQATGRAMPVPPGHLDGTMAADCHAIAEVLGQAVRKKYRLEWEARQYAEDAPKVSPYRAEREDRLLHMYLPLIPAKDIIGRSDHLPIIDIPAVITDAAGNGIVWFLPAVIPPHRQAAILQIMQHVRDELKTKAPSTGQGPTQYTKGWRTAPTFFTDGEQCGSGAMLLYPAGFQQGQKHATKGPSPSQDSGNPGAVEWMREFQVIGGLLDGMLAIVHPELYRSAIGLMADLFANHPASRAVVAQWPSCYSTIQIIANRETIRHRDVSAAPGWLDLLLTLGTYGETAVMELRNIGVTLSYDAGTVVLLSVRIVVHRVPKVLADRLCLAFYMDEGVFNWSKRLSAGMANVDHDVIHR